MPRNAVKCHFVLHHLRIYITVIYILLDVLVCSIAVYYMAVSHKDWELPNSRI